MVSSPRPPGLPGPCTTPSRLMNSWTTNRIYRSWLAAQYRRLPSISAVRLDRHDEPENREYPLQDHEGGRAGTRGAPLVRARGKHPEQTEQDEEPPGEGHQYGPVPIPTIV